MFLNIHVFLIGFMGSGKTTIGKRISSTLDVPFIDLDAIIEKEQGKSIPELFDAVGEASFREIEREALHRYAKGIPCILSTGGGVPCYFDNMEFMFHNGVTIYLKASPLELASRLSAGQESRPLIKNVGRENLPSHIESMLKTREPFYAKATFIVETDGRSDDEVVKHCLDIVHTL